MRKGWCALCLKPIYEGEPTQGVPFRLTKFAPAQWPPDALQAIVDGKDPHAAAHRNCAEELRDES